MNIAESFSYFVFGRACIACGNCGQKLDPYLCPSCKQELIEYGERPIWAGAGSDGSADAICLFPMNNLTRPLILAMKYKGMQKIASYLVAHSSVGRSGEGLQILRSWGGVNGDFQSGLVFIPVPVHSARKRERGYNQSEQAAFELSLYCGGKLQTDALKRRVYKPSQTLLGSTERSFNAAGAFEAKSANNADKCAIIVDDVYTTGATTSSCARALARAGWKNAKVCALLYESPVSVTMDRAADIRVGWKTEKD